jgi:lipopolysaccharide biosynthesis regulator YciM
LKPDDPTSYAELAQSYIDFRLLHPAQQLGEHAQSQLEDSSKIRKIVSDVEDAIETLFEEMKKEWMQGNMNATRKVLAEYLTLRPDDPQANELKRVIGEMDVEFAKQWSDDHKVEMADMPTRSQQVVRLVRNKQLEKAIGILEGMYHDDPDAGARVREQIGDIRMMQKSFPSAIWNYTRALELNPMRVEIQRKIDRVRQMHPGAFSLP